MEKTEQSADALELTQMISGNVITIEARTKDGRALSTLVRVILEIAVFLDPNITEPIEKLFLEFTQNVEDLFK
ncbi:MAG: hypothetical protein FWD81_00230 [Methanomassiliicoccaceae archaeon]|nr:hypothetical protein [Methanomassiliicoccaceae archaeon]